MDERRRRRGLQKRDGVKDKKRSHSRDPGGENQESVNEGVADLRALLVACL